MMKERFKEQGTVCLDLLLRIHYKHAKNAELKKSKIGEGDMLDYVVFTFEPGLIHDATLQDSTTGDETQRHTKWAHTHTHTHLHLHLHTHTHTQQSGDGLERSGHVSPERQSRAGVSMFHGQQFNSPGTPVTRASGYRGPTLGMTID